MQVWRQIYPITFPNLVDFSTLMIQLFPNVFWSFMNYVFISVLTRWLVFKDTNIAAKFIPKAIVFKGLSLSVSLRNAIFLLLWCKNNKWSYSWSKNRKKPSFNQISVTTSHWVHFKKSTVLWSKHFHFWKVYIFCFDKVMLACSSNFWLSNFQIFRD